MKEFYYDINSNTDLYRVTLPEKIVGTNIISNHYNMVTPLFEKDMKTVIGVLQATIDDQQHKDFRYSTINYYIRELPGVDLNDLPKDINENRSKQNSIFMNANRIIPLNSDNSGILPSNILIRGVIYGGIGIYSNIKGDFTLETLDNIRKITILYN